MRHARRLALALAASLTATQALAHATLETAEAPAGSTYKAVLRIPHGCDGKPTTSVRVRIPEGVIAVKPMPKAGWTLTTAKSAYAKTYDHHGTPLSEGVVEIAWTGGNLPDEWYDEFVFRVRLAGPAAGEAVYFPTVQECPDGAAERWIEIPAAGESAEGYDYPAPSLTITEPQKQAH